MPVLKIKALNSHEPAKVKKALALTTKKISEVHGCEQKYVWAIWEEIKPGFYFEGDQAAEIQPLESHPPICELMCFEGKTAKEIEDVLLAAAKTLSEALGIPNNIFMTYRKLRPGEVIAGDGIIRQGK